MGLNVKRRTVDIGEIHPNPWNYRGMSEAMFEKEVTSIRTYGYIRPILVRKRAAGGFEIIDGEHRWKATGSLGFERIEVDDLGDIDDRTAKKLTVVLNETHGDVRYDDLSKLIAELDAQGGHEDLLKELPFPDAELKALLALTDVPEYTAPEVTDLDDGEDRSSGQSKAGDEWETFTAQVPAAFGERFAATVKAITADVKRVPKDVRIGIALERLVDLHEAQAKTEERRAQTRTRRAATQVEEN